MNPVHLAHLVCPSCRAELNLVAKEVVNSRVKTGKVICNKCGRENQIVDYIPRFVSEEENYANGFGFQWNKHYLTQYDRYSGAPISEERFFKETRWGRNLDGKLVLEAGSGSGRFTEHAVATGAIIVSFDYSNAVEANYRSNGHFENLLIVQADIFLMPFRHDYFDNIFCIGVIQHTPNPEGAFSSLTKVLKPGGGIVIDSYLILPWWKHIFLTKYWVRPITRRIPPPLLYRFCEKWVEWMWWITGWARRLTGRRTLSWFLLIADFRGVYPLPDHIQKEWSILDTFDMLSPAYDYPQSIDSVTAWFIKEGYSEIEIGYGYNGIEGRGVKTGKSA